jgi:hypothetical protein
MLTVKEIDQEFKSSYRELLETHKSASLIPKDELNQIGEIYRAKMVILSNDGTKDARLLSQYSIPSKVIELICGEAPEIQRKVKKADRRRAMENFIRDNADSIVTPSELAEAGEVSYATAMKFINENPLAFIKTERGAYLIRDAEAERKAALQEGSSSKRVVRRKK